MGYRGVVAAGHELTVRAAERILQQGGNAFDAILAAHFAACVAEPVLASLGGGGFLIARPQGAAPVVYDFFVQTPRHKRPVDELDFRPILADFGTAQQEFHIGQATIATPGSVKGIFCIHRDLGSLPLAKIAAPAIEFARAGVPLNETQAYVLNIVRPIYEATPETRHVFCGGALRNRVLRTGELFRPTDLAATIERLVIEGDPLFYEGPIAGQIVAKCQASGGHLTAEDLQHYQVIRREPLCLNCFHAEVLTNPPPSSGGMLIAFALDLLESAAPLKDSFGTLPYLRLLADVIDLSQQARLDSRLTRDPAPAGAMLLQAELLERYRSEVLGRLQARRGTTHISVIDAQHNLASMTVSNGEGCGSIVPGTGIMLNNMLGENDLNPDGFHGWSADERMTSMMAPSLITTETGVEIATGSGGSNRIRTALLQVMMNLIHFRMDVVPAVESPRLHVEDGKLSVEGGFDPGVVAHLAATWPNHEIWPGKNLFFGGAHSVMAAHGEFRGVGDPRRGGVCRVVEA